MAKKPHIRTLMETKHVKVSKGPLQSACQYFCQIFWSLWEEISLKNSILVVCEILRLFANILTLDDKYSLSLKASV